MRTDFRVVLEQMLQEPLPGFQAQKVMIPSGRDILPDDTIKKNAAVALLIFPGENEKREIVFIRRPEYNGPHSGQVSFPGGKMDPEDDNLLETAIRECFEEIGVRLKSSDCVGSLSSLHISASGFLVHPYVFVLEKEPIFAKDDKEVMYLIRCSLEELTHDRLIKNTTLKIRNENIEVPYYDIQNEIVWGATAIILAEFIYILKRFEIKNPGLL